MLFYVKIFTTMLLVMLYYTGFSQDVLVKNDSTKLRVRIIEVGPASIKYKRESNPDGPLYSESKNEVTRIIYKDGSIDVFEHTKPVPTPASQLMFEPKTKRKPRSEQRVEDWIRMNFDFGFSYSKNYAMTQIKPTSYQKYSCLSYNMTAESDKTKILPYAAMNFIFGRHRVLRHFLGISYHMSKSNYIYNSYNSPGPPSTSYASVSRSTLKHIEGTYNFFDLNSGLNWKLYKGLNICMISSISFANARLVTTGYDLTTTRTFDHYDQNGIYIYRTEYDSTLYNKTLVREFTANLSFQTKMYYNFKVKENVLGFYILGNIALAANI